MVEETKLADVVSDLISLNPYACHHSPPLQETTMAQEDISPDMVEREVDFSAILNLEANFDRVSSAPIPSRITPMNASDPPPSFIPGDPATVH